jgi:hypothetical protein
MPSHCQFGTAISQNTPRGPNLTPTQRQQIISKAEAGVSVRELVEEFGRSPNCICTTLRLSKTRATTQEAPRSDWPPILSLREKKVIYQEARAAPKLEYSELAKVGVVVSADGTSSKPPSRSMLYRLLKRRNLTNFPCKQRPKLNRTHALKRLQFYRQYRTFKWSQRTLKFSDECSVQKGSGQNREWVFHYPEEKWKPEMLQTVSTSRNPAQMVWASIWLDKRGRARRSPLVILERDSNAPRGGYSAQGYIQALTKGLLPHWHRS